MRLRSISRAARSLACIGRWLPAGALAISLTLALGASAPAQTSGGAVYAVTYLDVSADWVVQGMGMLRQYRDASRHEPGNLEFSVLEETNRPNRFVTVEGWQDQGAFDAHAKSANSSQFNFILEAIRNSPPNQHVLRAFATSPAHAASAGAIYMVEHVDFQPTDGATAQPRVKALAEASQQEKGVVRYDIYQEPPPHANHYSVVAEWANRDAYDAHETADYTRQFRAPGRANLYDQRLYQLLD